MLKLNEPLTWSTILEFVRTAAVIGGLVWGVAYFTVETRGQDADAFGKIANLNVEVADMRRDSILVGNRLTTVETDIRYIRESLTRIERAISQRATP